MIWNKDSNHSGAVVSWKSPNTENPDDVWVELESDPGLFTRLIEDFGVKGVQVEEIYDLDSSLQNNTVYGFIFLFKWVEGGRRARGASLATSTAGTTVTDEATVNSMFFAQQIVTNACATHALLSILLNCDEDIELGPILTAFKQQTFGMTPEAKGNAVGESAKLAWAHNKHARPDALRQMERDASTSDVGRGKSVKRYRMKNQETFHFISYVPINGRLYELDGLKSYPVDHGEIPPGTLWTQHFQNVISERIGLANAIQESTEIRYNLMALVPSKKDQYQRSLDMLKMNRAILYEGLEKLIKETDPTLLEVAARNTDASGDDADVGASTRKKPRLDEAALISAARHLSSSRDSSDWTAPLTVVTSMGRETTCDFGVSSGNSDQSALNWPISTLEVVTVTKEAAGPTGDAATGSDEATRTPSTPSPLSSFSERDEHERNGGYDSAVTREAGDTATEESTMAAKRGEMDDGGTSEQADEKLPEVIKSVAAVKLETTGSQGFGLFEPLGLATYIQRLEEKIAVVERLLGEEIALWNQWILEDNRRTTDYDPFILAFLTLMDKEGVVPAMPSPVKNGKVKGQKNTNRGGKAGRKRRLM